MELKHCDSKTEFHKVLKYFTDFWNQIFCQFEICVYEMHNCSSKQRKALRSALFWDITQRRVVNVYRCFGTTYRSHLRGSRVLKSADLINVAAEAWNQRKAFAACNEKCLWQKVRKGSITKTLETTTAKRTKPSAKGPAEIELMFLLVEAVVRVDCRPTTKLYCPCVWYKKEENWIS
jgi:hypothetical protein